MKRKESARRAEKRREVQEQKRIKNEERLRGNETTEVKQERLLEPNQMNQQLPVGVIPPQMPPLEMKPLLSQMGFATGLAPFQIDPRSAYNHGYGGY